MMWIGIRRRLESVLRWCRRDAKSDIDGVRPPCEAPVQNSILSAPEDRAVIAEGRLKHAISSGMMGGVCRGWRLG